MSVAECSELFQTIPVIVTLVLEVVPVKYWHESDIASHVPGSQCAVALMSKNKALLQKDQVSEPHGNCPL